MGQNNTEKMVCVLVTKILQFAEPVNWINKVA